MLKQNLILTGTLMDSTGQYDLRGVNRIKILTGAFGLDVQPFKSMGSVSFPLLKKVLLIFLFSNDTLHYSS